MLVTFSFTTVSQLILVREFKLFAFHITPLRSFLPSLKFNYSSSANNTVQCTSGCLKLTGRKTFWVRYTILLDILPQGGWSRHPSRLKNACISNVQHYMWIFGMRYCAIIYQEKAMICSSAFKPTTFPSIIPFSNCLWSQRKRQRRSWYCDQPKG